MIAIADADDPEYAGYRELFEASDSLFSLVTMDRWMPMVHKLNAVAMDAAFSRAYFALGFAGDDHLPQTINWAQRYLTVLGELKTGMVYGDDGYQGANLSTEWAVTTDAVLALDRMVPADVEHMYCDNSILDLFTEAGAVRHLPEVRIEHMHPMAGKAESDDQYKRVNHRDQFRKDKTAYEGWRYGDIFLKDVAEIRHLRPGLPEVRPTRETVRKDGTAPRPVARRSAPRGNNKVPRRLPYPRHFRQVIGATPDEIGMTLADFASAVPADQEIVELGVFHGRTALMMAWGARQGNGAHVTAVDAWDLPGNTYDPPFNSDTPRRWAEHWLDTFGFKKDVTLIKAFASDAAQDWIIPGVADNKPVGLLFVDDDHTYAGVRAAVEGWAPHLAPGARIALDDYEHPDWPGVKEAINALLAEGVIEPVEVFHDRLAVTRLAGKGDASPSSQGAPGAASPEPPAEPLPQAITGEGVSPSPEPAADLQGMNLGQLRALARGRGVKLDPAWKKPEIISALGG